jgi:hypothetical protein
MVSISVVEVNEEKTLFQLFFLKDDEDQSVEVEEVEEVDFDEVKKRLEQGESVFITRKREQELDKTLISEEDAAELWFFSHI